MPEDRISRESIWHSRIQSGTGIVVLILTFFVGAGLGSAGTAAVKNNDSPGTTTTSATTETVRVPTTTTLPAKRDLLATAQLGNTSEINDIYQWHTNENDPAIVQGEEYRDALWYDNDGTPNQQPFLGFVIDSDSGSCLHTIVAVPANAAVRTDQTVTTILTIDGEEIDRQEVGKATPWFYDAPFSGAPVVEYSFDIYPGEVVVMADAYTDDACG